MTAFACAIVLVLSAEPSRLTTVLRTLTKTGDRPTALRDLQSSQPEALLAVALIQLRDEKYAEAVATLRRLNESNAASPIKVRGQREYEFAQRLVVAPKSVGVSIRAEWLRHEAAILLGQGLAAAAQAQLLDAIALEPRNHANLVAFGVAAMGAHDRPGARRAFGRAAELIALDGNQPALLWDVCRQADQLVREEQIIQAGRKAYEARLASDRLGEARWLAESSRASGGFGELAGQAGAAFLRAGQASAAQRETRGLGAVPGFTVRIQQVGLASPATDQQFFEAAREYSAGRTQQALATLKAIETRIGADPVTCTAMAETLARGGRYDDALSMLRVCVSLQPTDVAIQVALGRALALKGDFASAASVLESLRLKEPGFPGLDLDWAETMLASGNLEAAEHYFQGARASGWSPERAMIGLTQVFVRTDRPRDALELATQVVRDTGWSGAAHIALASALTATGNAELSKVHSRIAAQLSQTCRTQRLVMLGLMPAPQQLVSRLQDEPGKSEQPPTASTKPSSENKAVPVAAQNDPRFTVASIDEDARVKVISVLPQYPYYGIVGNGCGKGKVFVVAELLSSFDGLSAGVHVVLRVDDPGPAQQGSYVAFPGMRRAGKGPDGTLVYCGTRAGLPVPH